MEKGLKNLLNNAISTKLIVDKQNFQKTFYSQTFGLVYIIVKSWFPNEVDDIVSEIYVNKLLHLELEKYERIGDNLEGYIAVTVKHYCQDLWKAKKKEEEFFNHLSLTKSKDDIQSNLELDKFLEQLTDLQSKAIKLRYHQGLTYFEIQQALQLSSESAVRQHVSRGLKKLKEMLSP